MKVVKSGWMYLHVKGPFSTSWKLRYLVLYNDGNLAIFKRPKSEAQPPIYRINIPKTCKQILSGNLCYTWDSMQFPVGISDLDGLFAVKTKFFQYRRDFVFAAFDTAERREWEDVLLEAQAQVTCSDVFEVEILQRNCNRN